MRQHESQAASNRQDEFCALIAIRLPDGIPLATSQASVLQGQFIAWLRMQSDRPEERGMRADIARATGFSAGYVGRILAKQRKGELRLPTLERVARHRGWKLWQLLWCIENGVAEFPTDPLRRSIRVE
jgi:hypothetical protein